MKTVDYITRICSGLLVYGLLWVAPLHLIGKEHQKATLHSGDHCFICQTGIHYISPEPFEPISLLAVTEDLILYQQKIEKPILNSFTKPKRGPPTHRHKKLLTHNIKRNSSCSYTKAIQ